MTMTVNGTPSTISYTPVGAGSVSRTVEDKMREAISVLDFIPVSEHAGIYNNTSGYDAAAAFQAAANTGRPIYAPGRRYCIGSPVDLTNCPGIRGEGANNEGAYAPGATFIYALAPMSHMFKIGHNHSFIRDLVLDGTNQANHGIYVVHGNGSMVEGLMLQSFRLDGIHFAASGNNNLALVANCLIQACGSVHGAAQGASNSAGSATITLTGSSDLLALNPPIRPNVDTIQVGSGRAYTITQVTATTVTVAQPLPIANANASYAIKRGCGILAVDYGDNSVIKVDRCTFLNCQVAAIRDNQLYGIHAYDCVYESNGYGRIIGWPNGYTQGSREKNSYFETSYSGYHVLVEQCVNADIGIALGGIASVHIADSTKVHATTIDIEGLRLSQKVTGPAITANAPVVNVELGHTYHFEHSSAAADCVINLPNLSSSPNLRALIGTYEFKITLVFMATGGRTFTIKSPDHDVNQVPGTTGFVHTGSFRKRDVHFDAVKGWVVT